MLKNLDSLPADKKTAVKNNGGGHYNHTLFWESMSPDGGGEPDGDLAEAISSAFGSFSDFQAKLKETGVNQFGSGWSWSPRSSASSSAGSSSRRATSS